MTDSRPVGLDPADPGSFVQQQRLEAFGQLAAGLAHDFNNLLSVISGYADFLSDPKVAGDPQEAAEALGEIRLAVDRGATLTRQLLAFGRPQPKGSSLFRPSKLIEGMEGMLTRLVTKEIRLEVNFEPEVGWLSMEPGQLEQIVTNLVVNARDAAREGDTIFVALRREMLSTPVEAAGEYVCLVVRDTGQGIPPEVLSRIFEPYFTTKGQAGTGLGLAVVRAVADAHGGFVHATSEVGQGSCFKVYLPAYRPLHPESTQERLPGARVGAPLAAVTGLQILVVDDNEHLLPLLSSLLRRYGYEVLEARDGIHALQLVRGRKIDVVLTDVGMPDLGGVTLCRWLQTDFPHIPIVVMTGGALPDGLPGHYPTLLKPFDISKLLSTLREVADRG